jgi:hypothetical protein
VPVAPPTPDTRWRCAAYADLAGAPIVEETEVLGDVVEHVTCRWCGAVDQVELVARPDVEGAAPS